MNWFKSLWLTSEEREILRKAKQEKNKTVTTSATVSQEDILEERPYNKLLYSGRNITVIFPDGDILSKSDVGRDVFDAVKGASSKEFIRHLLIGEPIPIDSLIETQEEKALVRNNLDVLREHEDFQVIDGKAYLRGVNLPIPSVIAFSFIELLEKYDHVNATTGMEGLDELQDLDNKINALKMFWLKLALNPIDSSRTDLLHFVKKNDVRITENGNLVLYRRIVSSGTKDKTITTFVSQAYYDRKKQKKAHTHPRNYNVVRVDGQLLLVKVGEEIEGSIVLGNLLDMYKNLDNLDENKFVSYNSGINGRLTIKVGSIYKIDDKEIDLNNGNCASGGLHAAAVDYDYSDFGDTPVVVLVNPSKAITVPIGDVGKMRTTEMFVACVNDKPIGTHFDESALAAFDEEYHDLTMNELEEAVKGKTFTKLTIKDKKPVVDIVDIEKIKELLKSRIQTV